MGVWHRTYIVSFSDWLPSINWLCDHVKIL